ncbi:MAG: hypothetical protein ACXVW5_32290 [Solirubrobacteraceae bacterium]
MATTPTKRKPAAKAPARRKPAAHAARPTAKVDTTAKLSEDVLETIEKSQRVAIDAVRKFVDTVDHALPALPHGDGPTARQEVVDSALEMADRLVHAQYDFIRKVIDSASKTVRGSDDAKK